MTYSTVNHGVMAVRVDLQPMSTEETMGQRITRQMEVKRLSQVELARVLGVGRMTVNQWVHDVSEPTPDNLLKIAEVLFEGDVHYLVHGPSRQPPGGFPSAPSAPSNTGKFKAPFRTRR